MEGQVMAEKVLIDGDNRATFTCPACHSQKTVVVSGFPEEGPPRRISCRCPCGNRFAAVVERRRSARRELNLPGRFISQRSPFRGLIRVLNISRSGVRVQVNGRPRFAAGERLLLEFELDDANRSTVRREVEVLSILENRFSARFTAKGHYDELGPYLYYNGLSADEKSAESSGESRGRPWWEFFEGGPSESVPYQDSGPPQDSKGVQTDSAKVQNASSRGS
jgi:hypothetical protein